MKYVSLESVLQSEQKYILQYAKKFVREIQAVKHKTATDTCFEKAELLGWDPKKVVKAVFFHRKNYSYGFIFPEIGTREFPQHINSRQLFPKLGIAESKSQAEKFSNSYRMEGMDFGTHSPFVLEKSFFEGEKILRKIFVYDFPKLNSQKVDISIGGFGEEAHKISVHLYYRDIFGCLNWKFPGKIGKFVF